MSIPDCRSCGDAAALPDPDYCAECWAYLLDLAARVFAAPEGTT